MGLKPVYFKESSGTGLPYIKAIVYEEDIPFFIGKGAIENQPKEIQKESEDISKTINPDKGPGVPGSLDWHKSQLLARNTKESIFEYAQAALGNDISSLVDSGISIKATRLAVYRLIKESIANGDQD